MSVEDIILDRVKDRLFHKLHGENWKDRVFISTRVLFRKVRAVLMGTHYQTHQTTIPHLKKWDIEYVEDLIEFTTAYYSEKISGDIRESMVQTTKDEKNGKEEARAHSLELCELNDQIIEGIADKILEYMIRLDNCEEEPPYLGENHALLQHQFPFNTKSLLQMCWSMTLNFSSETQEQALGAIFNSEYSDQFKQIFSPRLTTNLDDTESIFLLNLQMSMASSIRNLGLMRQTHTEYLTFNEERRLEQRQNVEDIADYGSLEDSGLIAKIGSFLGVGSFATIAGYLNHQQQLPVLIPLFALGGVLGAVAVTVGAKIYVILTEDSWDRKTRQEQNRYWKEHYKKDVTNELYYFYTTILGLIDKFYPVSQRDEIVKNDEFLRWSEYPVYIKKLISDQILPPDNLQWFPIIPTPQASQSSSQAATSNSASSISNGSGKGATSQ